MNTHTHTTTSSAKPGMPTSTTTTGGGSMVTAIFPDRESAEAAYNAANTRGYAKDDVNLVMSDETRKRHFADQTTGQDTELGNKAAEGAGAASGGLIGALIGWNIPEERVKH